MKNPLATYQKNQVAGMGQKDLILLLYNGALKFLRQAQEELDNERTDAFADRVERVHRIIFHLYTTLDFDKGGEIAEKLGSLYSFIISQLYILNSTRSPEIIRDIGEILSGLKDGWQGVDSQGISETSNVENQEQTSGGQRALSVQV